MSNQKARSGIVRAFLKVAVAALLILAVVGCSDSESGTGPSPTPRSVLFATPPAVTSSSADDQPAPGIVVQLDSTATPYPTADTIPNGDALSNGHTLPAGTRRSN